LDKIAFRNACAKQFNRTRGARTPRDGQRLTRHHPEPIMDRLLAQTELRFHNNATRQRHPAIAARDAKRRSVQNNLLLP